MEKNNNSTLHQKVEALMRDQTINNHQIARGTGIHYSAVHKLRQGRSKVENIRLAQAEKYADFYDSIQPKP